MKIELLHWLDLPLLSELMRTDPAIAVDHLLMNPANTPEEDLLDVLLLYARDSVACPDDNKNLISNIALPDVVKRFFLMDLGIVDWRSVETRQIAPEYAERPFFEIAYWDREIANLSISSFPSLKDIKVTRIQIPLHTIQNTDGSRYRLGYCQENNVLYYASIPDRWDDWNDAQSFRLLNSHFTEDALLDYLRRVGNKRAESLAGYSVVKVDDNPPMNWAVSRPVTGHLGELYFPSERWARIGLKRRFLGCFENLRRPDRLHPANFLPPEYGRSPMRTAFGPYITAQMIQDSLAASRVAFTLPESSQGSDDGNQPLAGP